MNIPRTILLNYIQCWACVCVAYAFMPFDGILPFSIARGILWLAILGIGVTTFRWAITRGYPARDQLGRFKIVHIFRSLMMTGIMTFVVFVVSTPVFMLVEKIYRK